MPHAYLVVLARSLGCSLLACASLAYAQRPERGFLAHDEAWPVGLDTAANWGVSDDGSLIVVDLSIMASAQAACGVVVPGGVFVMSEGEALVCGRDGLGVGLLEHWRFNSATGTLEILDSLRSAGMDFAGVVYDAVLSRVYLLDCVGNQIVKGAWDGSSPLGAVSLSILVDSSTVPFLGEAPSLMLVPSRNLAAGVVNLIRWPMRRGVAFAEITDGASPLVTYAIDNWCAPSVSLNDLTVTEGAMSVEVWAPPDTSVEVLEDESFIVLGGGVVGATGVLNVTLTQPLAIGSRYMARADGAEGEVSTVCVCRHGFAETFASGATLDGFYYQSGAEIGQPFVVEVGVHAGPQGGPAVYEGIMLIGFRIGGVDPVIPYGANWLLSTGAYVPAQGFMSTSGWGMISGEVNIPNDPGLVGLVFLAQFAMEDGQDYVLSEVYGAIMGLTQLATSSHVTTAMSTLAASYASSHLQAALAAGQVFDATPKLIEMLLRR